MPRHNDLIENLNKSTIFCNNLGFGEQGAVLNEIKKGIYVCPNIEKARQMQDQLKALNCNNVLLDDFNKPFTLSKFESVENKIDTLKTIHNLCSNDCIVISTANIFFSFLPNLKYFKENILTIDKSKEYNLQDIEKKLIESNPY